MAALYFDATGLAYSFDDGHIAVRTVHSVKHVPTHQSSITRHGKVALSVKYVAADLSSITTVPSGTDCQICHELRHRRRLQFSGGQYRASRWRLATRPVLFVLVLPRLDSVLPTLRRLVRRISP